MCFPILKGRIMNAVSEGIRLRRKTWVVICRNQLTELERGRRLLEAE